MGPSVFAIASLLGKEEVMSRYQEKNQYFSHLFLLKNKYNECNSGSCTLGHAYHGCLEEEKIIGGNYIIDVDVFCDFKSAAIEDDLNKTIRLCGCKRYCCSRNEISF